MSALKSQSLNPFILKAFSDFEYVGDKPVKSCALVRMGAIFVMNTARLKTKNCTESAGRIIYRRQVDSVRFLHAQERTKRITGIAGGFLWTENCVLK